MNPDDPRHGTENGYGNLDCRCADCREAHRLVKAERRHRPGRDFSGMTHGTSGTYTDGCRCAPCCAAHTAYCTEWRRQRGA